MKYILTAVIAFAISTSILYAQDPSSRLVPDSNGVYTTVQKLAKFEGGEKAMMDFIGKAIKYPKAELKNDIQGKVSIEAIIDEHGKIVSSKIAGSVSPGLDKEALRVVSTFPTLVPAVVNGKNV